MADGNDGCRYRCHHQTEAYDGRTARNTWVQDDFRRRSDIGDLNDDSTNGTPLFGIIVGVSQDEATVEGQVKVGSRHMDVQGTTVIGVRFAKEAHQTMLHQYQDQRCG